VRLSTRNQIPAKVVSVNLGEATANVVMDANGQRLVATITAEAVRELGIEEGSEVIALVKASDVMIATED
jgi:molybdate transport system regulatory protein